MPIINTDTTDQDRINADRESDADVIYRLDRYFHEAVEHPVWKAWRQNAEQDYKYREGDQWTSAERAALQKRKQPEIVENRIREQVNRLKGKFRKNHVTTTFVGTNSPVDDQTAQLLADLKRWRDQANDAEYEQLTQFEDGITGGFGVTEFYGEENELGQMVQKERCENPFFIYPDPYSRRYDWNDDARYIIRSKWIDLDEAIAIWPDKEMGLRNCVHHPGGRYTNQSLVDPEFLRKAEDFYIDSMRQRLRPVEVWYKRKAIRYGRITATGVVVDVAYADRKAASRPRDGTLIKRIQTEIWLGIYCGGLLIHHDRSPYTHNLFPFVPFFADRKKDGEPFGHVRNLITLQNELNKRRSKALHLLSTNRAVYTRNAVEDKNQLAEEIAKPDGLIELRGGKIGESFELSTNTEMGNSQMAMHQETRQAFDDTTGFTAVSRGEAPGEVRSDRGLQRLAGAVDDAVLSYFDNYRRTRKLGTRLQYHLFKQYVTEEMAFQVTDDPNAARVVQVTHDDLAALKEHIYDIRIVESFDYVTRRQHNFDTISGLLPQIIPLGPQWMKVLFAMSDIPEKEGLIKIIDQMMQTPPRIDPKVSMALSWGEMTPPEKIAWALKLNMPELAKLLAQGGEPSKQQLQAMTEAMKQQSKERMEMARLDSKDVESRRKSGTDLLMSLDELDSKERIETMKAKAKPHGAQGNSAKRKRS